jgi:molybdenum cofactor cytidylyltransferase
MSTHDVIGNSPLVEVKVSMQPERIAGIVLAAGLSSRMGRNKMLVELDGRSVVRRAVETAIAAGLSPILVVMGHEHERVEAELEGLACLKVINPDYAQGMNTSLRAGIAAVPGDCAAALLMLADMPLVDARMLGDLCAAFRSEQAPLVVSTYDQVVAPPIVYGRALFAELLALRAEDCGKRVVKAHRDEALELAWPASALTDLDHPGDLDRVLAELQR